MKKKPIDFMIFDFETLDSRSWKSMVLSFGCIVGYWEDLENININKLLSNGTELYFDIKNQGRYNRVYSKDTLDWWKRQSKEAQDVFKTKEKIDLKDFPDLFTDICFKNGANKDTAFFVRGKDFDAVIIHSIFDYFNKPLPYHHFNLRYVEDMLPVYKCNLKDIRSIMEAATGNSYLKDFNDYCNKKYNLQKHNAIHDCARDIIQLYYGITKSPEEINDLYQEVGMSYLG